MQNCKSQSIFNSYIQKTNSKVAYLSSVFAILVYLTLLFSFQGRLMLRISLESVLHDAKWKWSEPFSIREGIFTSKIGKTLEFYIENTNKKMNFFK